MLHKIISGGQTGADMGGLIAAHKLNVQTGGTAPDGFMTAIGPNPLLELLGLVARGTLKTRTLENIRSSGGTVILTERFDSPGSVLTRRFCRENGKPYLDIDLGQFISAAPGALESSLGTALKTTYSAIVDFVRQHQISVLNIAGNRERRDRNDITKWTEIIIAGALELLELEGELTKIDK